MADSTTPGGPTPVEGSGDWGARTPDDVMKATPGTTKGSGQFAVYDHDLGQFVSGVSNKADAEKSRKALKGHNGAITDGHKLETLEV